ncbi:hypothetical protein [Nocardia asiatica]|uniref:hypothetical protein n=1 Tax=Nocardia asiatica TaxID=209252 RepID=UPI0024555B1D|nr:hypothetical protein [Nocardia asiatica]
MPTNPAPASVTEMTVVTFPCPKCDSPACLGLVRSESPPAGLLDFLDRQIKLVSSGHWHWSTVGYCAVIIGVVVAAVAIIVSPFALTGPIGATTGVVAGTGVLTGTGFFIRWRRNRRAPGSPASVTALPDIPTAAQEQQPERAA